MSFLNSVLNNIGKEKASYTPITAPPTAKRKAEDELPASNGKAVKKVIRDGPGAGRDAAVESNRKLPPHLHPLKQPGPSKPLSSSAPATPVSETPKQPKKGSYQEIMARAKAQKEGAKAPVVGTISHKPKDKIEISHKQEKKMKMKAMRDKKLGVVRAGNGGSSSTEGSRSNSLAPGIKASDKKKADHAYNGTAKSKAPAEQPKKPQPAYRGTMGAKLATADRRNEKSKPRPGANQYVGTDDELDSYDESAGDGYGDSGEESDDMEAGFSDVEQEEAAALRMARKEDEAERRLESELKRQKETRKVDTQRKNALSALAAKQRPRQY